MTQSTNDQRRPFLSAPSPQRYFAAGGIEDARQRIVRAIARSEGPAILVGGAGTGKSLLLAVLAEQFAARMAVVTLAGAQLCTRRALLQMILFELGLPYRDMDEGELRLAILAHLRGASAGAKAPSGAKRLLLLVDEADSLPIRLLEELRVLTNVAADGLPLVSLVLAGGPILEERFAEPQLDMFSQRIAARCYLAPLGREETLQYVRSQVAAAGVKPEKLLTADALEAIHAATGGVPRLVNQLGDQLTWVAQESGTAPLRAEHVQQAWSDLQQLPAPWNTAQHAAAVTGDAGVIEFGDLDGDASANSPATLGEPVARGMRPAADADDDVVASIPIAAGRLNRAVLDIETPSFVFDEPLPPPASIDVTAELDDDDAEAGDDGEAPAAVNPFDEPFDDEEIVVDPYAAFEAEMLRSAPQVVNRLDRLFAGELHRCVARALTGTAAAPTESSGRVAAARDRHALAAEEDEIDELAAVRLPAVAKLAALSSPRELLVIDDEDDAGAAAVIPGRQFRRLFSALESSARSLG